MNTPKRARIVAAGGSSSSYSLRERPEQENLFKSKSSVYSLRKTENRGIPVAGRSSLFTPNIDKTLIKKKNRGRSVAAGLCSSYSLRERPKENDGTNRENVSGSKMVRVPESLNDDVPQPMELEKN
uniref:Uncharacterized protein n=1 Tax=Panagrolaimus superbus TaxID=310955 RepID=A0A914YRJ7_9BILA